MATHCTHCGEVLPREDARFCSNCGNVLSPQSLSPQSLSIPTGSPSPLQQEKKPFLREQIAQHSPDRPIRPVRYTRPDEPPAWMKQLEVNEHRKYTPEMSPLQQKQQIQEVAEKSEGKAVQNESVATEKEDLQKQARRFPAPPVETPQPPILENEPRGNAGPESEAFSLREEVERSAVEPHLFIEEREFPLVERDISEDLPTEEVEAIFDERPLKGGMLTEPVPVIDLNSDLFVQERELHAKQVIEDQPTRPMPRALPQPSRGQREEPLPPGPSPEDRKRIVAQFDTMLLEVPRFVQPGTPRGGAVQTFSSLLARFFSFVQVLPSRQRVGSLKPEQRNTPRPPHWQSDRQRMSVQRNQESNRLILLLIGILLIILVVAGVGIGIWVSLARASLVPTVTQPWQRFEDKKLGFSISYPSGWKQEVDGKKSSVHFYDSSRTNQIDILVERPQGVDIAQYLQQQAKALELTEVKPGTPLSFAGVLWQRIEGNRVIQGANYTESIFATVYSNRLYTFTQLAHQSIYAESEKINFSSMRKTFLFL